MSDLDKQIEKIQSTPDRKEMIQPLMDEIEGLLQRVEVLKSQAVQLTGTLKKTNLNSNQKISISQEKSL